MPADWVTVDKFEDLTGINRDFVLQQCRKGDWPEGYAWDKLSPKIYLINVNWWNKWRETAAASRRRQNQALKLNSHTTASDAGKDSNASPRPPILDV